MKKLGSLLFVIVVLAAVPAAFAATAPAVKGTLCRGAEYSGLHVHQVTCRAALMNIQTGNKNKAFTCRASSRNPPFLETCISRKHRSAYYDFIFYGG